MRLKKVLDDIQKTEDKILELQEYVKKLKIQKKQMEDAEIISTFFFSCFQFSKPLFAISS